MQGNGREGDFIHGLVRFIKVKNLTSIWIVLTFIAFSTSLSRMAWINCKCSLFRSSYQDLSTNVTSSSRSDKKEIRKESHDESVVFWKRYFSSWNIISGEIRCLHDLPLFGHFYLFLVAVYPLPIPVFLTPLP